MHLADFIESHLDLLVADWIEFARRLTDDSQDLSDEELKDLAAQLMLAIAADLRAPHINVGRIAALHAGRFAGPATISRVARGHAEERRVRKQLGDENAIGCFDEQRLTRVVVNLLVNAVQHGDPRAEIAVEPGRQDEGFALAVSNHGQTLPPELLATVFDPLRGAAQGTSAGRVGKGVGLGLYIVREIVRAHGGHVVMQSSGGVTTGRVWLPADGARVSPSPSPARNADE
jgi:signal transduction histidine kinase